MMSRLFTKVAGYLPDQSISRGKFARPQSVTRADMHNMQGLLMVAYHSYSVLHTYPFNAQALSMALLIKDDDGDYDNLWQS